MTTTPTAKPRLTAIALIRCSLQGDTEGALELLRGTVVPLETIRVLCNFSDAVAKLAGGEDAPAFKEVRSFVGTSRDMGESLTVLPRRSATCGADTSHQSRLSACAMDAQ